MSLQSIFKRFMPGKDKFLGTDVAKGLNMPTRNKNKPFQGSGIPRKKDGRKGNPRWLNLGCDTRSYHRAFHSVPLRTLRRVE